MPPNLDGLLQFGFAAVVAAWLIHFVTNVSRQDIRANTLATLQQGLIQAETLKLLLQIMMSNHDTVPTVCEQAIERVEALQSQIKDQIDKHGR